MLESSLSWVLAIVPLGDGPCPEYQCYNSQAELPGRFLQKPLGAWIFLHVKEVWLHASSWNWVCKYIKCLIWEKKTKTFHRGKLLLENNSEAASIMKCLFLDREEWEMVLPLVFPYIVFTMTIFRHLGC